MKKLIIFSMLLVLLACNSKNEKKELAEPTKMVETELKSEAETMKQESVNIENQKWVLFEIMGQAVEQGDKTPNFTLNKEKNSISGNNGCNLFTSSYELKEGNSLKIGNMASTLMACENTATATSFMEVIQKIDNYSLKDGVLSLNKARMAPLAKFKLAE